MGYGHCDTCAYLEQVRRGFPYQCWRMVGAAVNRSELLKRAGLVDRPQSGRLTAYTAWLMRFGFIADDMKAFLGGSDAAQAALPRMWDACAGPLSPEQVVAEVEVLLRCVPRGAQQYRARRELMQWLAGAAAPEKKVAQ